MSSEYDNNLESDLREVCQAFLYINLMKTGPSPGGNVFQNIITILAILIDHLKTFSNKY